MSFLAHVFLFWLAALPLHPVSIPASGAVPAVGWCYREELVHG